MESVFNFYLNEVIGKEVFFEDRQAIGKIQDVIVSLNYLKPKVYAVEVNFGGFTILVKFSSLIVTKDDNQYFINCNKTAYIEGIEDNSLFLKRHVIDKKVIDSKGKKADKVKDIKLVYVTSGAYIVGAKLVLEGFIAKLLAKGNLSKLINWNEVEKIDFFKNGMKVCKLCSKLEILKHDDVINMMNELENSNTKIQCA